MASFVGRRRAAPAWSIDDASTFAALKEFKLLQLLSTDKKALTTARRLGLSFSQSQSRSPSSASAAGSGTTSGVRPPGAAAVPATVGQNARQRRSAARSARRHAARRAQLCSRTMLAILFMVRTAAAPPRRRHARVARLRRRQRRSTTCEARHRRSSTIELEFLKLPVCFLHPLCSLLVSRMSTVLSGLRCSTGGAGRRSGPKLG